MDADKILKAIKFFFGDNPIVLIGAATGGIGIVNVLDSAIATYLGIQWAFVPEELRPLFMLVRDLWQWLIGPLLVYLPFALPEPAKNYLLMGAITAGMRIRSSFVILNALNDGSIDSYTQKTIISSCPLVLRKKQYFKFYLLFLPIRLFYAFFMWPIKILGAALRYRRGEWRAGFDTDNAIDARQKQYTTFFNSIFWALFIIFVCIVLSVAW